MGVALNHWVWGHLGSGEGLGLGTRPQRDSLSSEGLEEQNGCHCGKHGEAPSFQKLLRNKALHCAKGRATKPVASRAQVRLPAPDREKGGKKLPSGKGAGMCPRLLLQREGQQP